MGLCQNRTIPWTGVRKERSLRMKQTPQKVMLAMSGGVDSSASAILLLEEGCELLGATLQLFPKHAGEREAPAALHPILRMLAVLQNASDSLMRCFLY